METTQQDGGHVQLGYITLSNEGITRATFIYIHKLIPDLLKRILRIL